MKLNKNILKVLCIGLLFSISNTCFGSVYDTLQMALDEGNLDRSIHCLRTLKKQERTLVSDLYNHSDYDSFYTYSFQIQTYETAQGANKPQLHAYALDLICLHQKIIYSRWEDWGMVSMLQDFKSDSIKRITRCDSPQFKPFEIAYYAQFNKAFNPEIFFLKNGAYGDGCGYTGSTPTLRRLMEEMLTLNDSNGLFSWLCTPYHNYHVYAIEGFYELEKKGMRLSDLQWQTIQYFKNSNASIMTCGGCFYYPRTVIDCCKHFKFKKRKKSRSAKV